MFAVTDTIVAIATPPGRGGIGVVRISGPDASRIARSLLCHEGDFEPRRATFTKVRLKPDTATDDSHVTSVASGFSRTSPDAIDHAVVTSFPRPASYTGDDVIEISAHGSPVVLRQIVEAAVCHGGRLAERGEFTLRAFLNGRIDLMQAEAVADLIEAATPLQARAAFDQLEGTLTHAIAAIDEALFDLAARLEASIDFPDEGYHFVEPGAVALAIDGLLTQTGQLLDAGRRGRLIREGAQVAIVGRPNVGKSSLFNALVGSARAIVTDTPGTTRDFVTEAVDLAGVRVTFVDTAGLRDARDAIEAEGIARSRQSARVADLVVQVVVDDVPEALETSTLVVQNKRDLGESVPRRAEALPVSARTGEGLDELRAAIVGALSDGGELGRERPEITNVRHLALMQHAHESLLRARDAALASAGALSEEFVLADLQAARTALEEITGRRAPEDLLTHIFERFCIGK